MGIPVGYKENARERPVASHINVSLTFAEVLGPPVFASGPGMH